LAIRKSDYIAAVHLQGASTARIIFGHVMPMCIPSVIVRITLNMAAIILTAAGLGFLGLGAQAPSPEWGAMLSTAREFVLTNGLIAA
ncbi:ABC transporter permease subunit, partial [Mycobacterium tuberculosis]|nr:ABC transporter permease subunit [Mycobacterium tuberculosis]